MDPSDWFQGTMSDDGGLDSSSPLAVDMLACSRPLMERRLRPPHDQAIKCPRCESTHTKFCYYNNYSLSQPRYFCKTCRRYWTKGGTLRNIPVGGGCRKNKKSSSSSSSKKPSSIDNSETSIGHGQQFGATTPNTTDLQLSFRQLQLPHHLIGGHSGGLSTSFLDNKYNALLDRSPNVDFLENKFGALASQNVTRGHDLLGSSNIGIIDGVGFGLDHNFNVGPSNLFVNNIPSSSLSFGVTAEGSSSGHVLDNSFQRLMLPYDYHEMNSNEMGHQSGIIDMKPSTKLLTLEWQGNNGGASENKDSFGYNNGLSSWGGSMLNGYTPSTS